MLCVSRRLILVAFALTWALTLGACGAVGGGAASSVGPTANNPTSGAPSGGGIYKPTPLLWEGVQKDGVLWSAFTYQIIGNDVAMELLPGTDDMADFCPNYAHLDNDHRVNFWAFLISAIAKYESGFDPTNRFKETALGIDAITNLPVYSEGLLQLSYQDGLQYSFCQFDWLEDQKLPANYPKKSILDPFRNLECGTKILAEQVTKTKRIGLSSGVYWSTLKVSGKNSKLKEIEGLTQNLPFCAASTH